jgi:hypothetical protein
VRGRAIMSCAVGFLVDGKDGAFKDRDVEV